MKYKREQEYIMRKYNRNTVYILSTIEIYRRRRWIITGIHISAHVLNTNIITYRNNEGAIKGNKHIKNEQ
jgi:hypothetical protein